MISSRALKIVGTPRIGVDHGVNHNISVPNRLVDEGNWIHSDIEGVPITPKDRNLPLVFGSQLLGKPAPAIVTATVKNFPDALAPVVNSGMIYGGSCDSRIRQ
jgi:hypothetical protein